MAKGTSLGAARQQATWLADADGVAVVKYDDGSFGVVRGRYSLGSKLKDGSEVYDLHSNGMVYEAREMKVTVFKDDDRPSWGRK